jgi:hypothetical protein
MLYQQQQQILLVAGKPPTVQVERLTTVRIQHQHSTSTALRAIDPHAQCTTRHATAPPPGCDSCATPCCLLTFLWLTAICDCCCEVMPSTSPSTPTSVSSSWQLLAAHSTLLAAWPLAMAPNIAGVTWQQHQQQQYHQQQQQQIQSCAAAQASPAASHLG